MSVRRRGVIVAWIVAISLFTVCWFVPIAQGEGKTLFGYDGALMAHKLFVELFEAPPSIIESPTKVFVAIFAAIGWMANELFVLGVIIVWKWPAPAVRAFALSLGVMISWHVVYFAFSPFAVGYWLWVAAGVMALWLSALRLTEKTEGRVTRVLSNKVTLALLIVPIVNAALAVSLA